MNDFVRCNKLTGVHWLKGSIKDLKVRIRIKQADNVISLPKFEDYSNETGSLNLEQSIKEFTFNWQEKIFSASEIQRYKDVHNCLTENELQYHDLVNGNDILPSKVFTYIHEDYFMLLPQEKKKSIGVLSTYMEILHLDDAFGRIGDAFSGKTSSEKHLFKSQEDIYNEDEEWMAMHVVFDHSEYNKDILVIKQEVTLLSLYHNIANNYIIIKPDQNDLDNNPYEVESNTGDILGQKYEIQIEFGDVAAGEELKTLLMKLYKKWEKKHKQLMNFVMPPVGKIQVFVKIELMSAKSFNCGDMYIEFNIKLPEGVQSSDNLHGRTHITEAASSEQSVWNYGHLIELCLEMDAGRRDEFTWQGVDVINVFISMMCQPHESINAKIGACYQCGYILPLNLYFESVSVDFWNRHRTEGYAHLSVSLTPGISIQELRCVRPDEISGAEDRRFFVGGCHLIKDLEVLSRSDIQNGDYTYTETGIVQIRYSTVSQASLPTNVLDGSGDYVHYETSSASALLLGAEAALRKYKKARARLAHASTRSD